MGLKLAEMFDQGLALLIYDIARDRFTFRWRAEDIEVRTVTADVLPFRTWEVEGMRVARVEDVRAHAEKTTTP